jgi:CRP-like cAMP-binding protein
MDTSDIELLKNCSLLKELTADEITHLFDITEVRLFSKSETLFKEGDKSKSIYVVLKGFLGVRKRIVEKKDNNKSLIPVIAEIGPGETIGEFAFFDDNPRSAEVFAMVDSQALVIAHDVFCRFTDEFPKAAQKITRNLVKILIARMRKTNKKLSIALEWGWHGRGFHK